MELYLITYRERFTAEWITVQQKGRNVNDAIDRLKGRGISGTVYDCTWVNTNERNHQGM